MNAEARQELLVRCKAVQNHPANCMVDIVTFAYMAETIDQLRRHVEYYEARAGVGQ